MTLQEYMRANGFTDAQCADAIGTTQPTVSRYRRGTRKPREPYLSRIIEWSGGEVQPNDFYGLTAPAEAAP